MPAALSLRGIAKSFDGRAALDDVSFTAEWGTVHALLGENGAGKSTLMNIACGLYAPDAGEIVFDGEPVRASDPALAKALGVGMVHQHFKLIRPFTVVENVMLANPAGGFAESLESTRRKIAETAERLGLPVELDARIDSISVAEQQRVEIIKVLLSGARLLILDEPTAVLTDEEADRLLTTMRTLAAEGKAIVLVTHKLDEVPRYADRVTVMRAGRNVATAAAGDLSVGDLARLMVGDAPNPPRRGTVEAGDMVLEVRDLVACRTDGAATLNGASLSIRAGEIYGIAGVGGNGQTELAHVLCGLMAAESGSVRLAGRDVTTAAPEETRAAGIASIPAERNRFALAEDMNVADNLAVTRLVRGEYGGRAWVRGGDIGRAAETAIEHHGIAGARSSTRSGLLSGGNAQKLILARELREDARLLIAHSPTRGLDVRACASVHDRLLAARDKGVAILLISEDLDEVLTLSDRIGVMNRGRIVAEFDAPVEREAVGNRMVGHA